MVVEELQLCAMAGRRGGEYYRVVARVSLLAAAGEEHGAQRGQSEEVQAQGELGTRKACGVIDSAAGGEL